MRTPTPTIPELVALWYETIGALHHKDRDCHFRIVTHWRYAGELDYQLEHVGYLLDRIEETFETYELAEERLRELLVTGITDGLDHEDCEISVARRAAILAILPSL